MTSIITDCKGRSTVSRYFRDMEADAMSGLQRFTDAQKMDFDTALAEIRNGRKESHWMWYIFPQLGGLGFSSMSEYYGIKNLKEAEDFLNDPYLGENLRTISKALLELKIDDPHQVFGGPDDLKLLSCMTLFEAAEGRGGVFTKVIEKYYKGRRDRKTEKMLGRG